MYNATIINTFKSNNSNIPNIKTQDNQIITTITKSNNSNIPNIKTQDHQIITTITVGILKLKPMNKKPIVGNYTFFTVITFSNINSFTYANLW